MKTDPFENLKKEVNEIQNKYPHLSLDNCFVAWFIRAFITGDEQSAVEAVKGGPGDKSTDALYIDEDTRTVFIVQGKYHQKAEVTAKRSAIVELLDLGIALLNEHTRSFDAIILKANALVAQCLPEARRCIQKKGYKLALQFVTSGKISSTDSSEATTRLSEWEQARFEPFSRADLFKRMQDYLEGASPAVPAVYLRVNGGEPLRRHDEATGITSYIFTMSGSDVGNLYRELGIRVFARNIRGYLGGATEVNRGMKHTIEEEPEYFWYFNNGITIVCDLAKKITEGGEIKILAANGQIINGQQTTRTLANYTRTDAEVIVRLIHIPRETQPQQSKYSKLITEIVSATNFQNAISQSDLKSNDAEQVRIERELNKLNYFYLRKRMNRSEAVRYGADRYRHTIKREELGRFMAAVNLDPYEARQGLNWIFEDDVYPKIFDGRKAYHYLAIYWLGREVSWWATQNSHNRYSKWLVLHTVWADISKVLNSNSKRSRFVYMMERERKFEKALKPLHDLIKETFRQARLFYKENRYTPEGKPLLEIDFFKHRNRHKELRAYLGEQDRPLQNKLKALVEALAINIDNHTQED